jgi:acetoin utilization deacetylase AcuC-like enzyme
LNKLNIIYHPEYDIPVPSTHRFVGTKFSDLYNHLQTQPFASKLKVSQPTPAPREHIARAHYSSYIEKVSKNELSKDDLRLISLPWSERLRNRSFLAIEGTYQTARQALKSGIACHVGGGTHHAHRDHGMGFCVFNDLGYAAKNLIAEDHVQKVLILDLDVHQGDGTIDICQGDPQIFTCSIHSESNFPFEKKQGWMDIGLPAGTKDETYLDILSQTLQSIRRSLTPDLVLFDAGIDVYSEDGLGNLELSIEGIRKRDRLVLEYYRGKNIPVATVIGGGYSKDTQELAHRHGLIFESAIHYL